MRGRRRRHRTGEVVAFFLHWIPPGSQELEKRGGTVPPLEKRGEKGRDKNAKKEKKLKNLKVGDSLPLEQSLQK